jgi:hypothetical protein
MSKLPTAASLDCIRKSNQEIVIKIKAAANGQPRYVDSSCSICLLEYEVGNVIIRVIAEGVPSCLSSRLHSGVACQRQEADVQFAANFLFPVRKLMTSSSSLTIPTTWKHPSMTQQATWVLLTTTTKNSTRIDLILLAQPTADLEEHHADVTHTQQ